MHKLQLLLLSLILKFPHAMTLPPGHLLLADT